MGQWDYLALMAGCLLITLPLELLGARVYRRPVRMLRAILPVAVLFLIWDAIAIAAGVWTYNPAFVTGVVIPPSIPLEELVFFLVIPLCGLLTFEAVERILPLVRGRARGKQEGPR